MSEFNPESLENNCRSLRMEPSLSDFQVAWIMDLANKSEQLTADNARLRNERDTMQREFELTSIDNSRLRKAIEEAPCDCISNWTLDTIGNHKADCWKRNALEGEE